MILLTGATGFLGSRLCAQLLRRTDEEITCIVRASDDRQAAKRLRETIRAQEPGPDIADTDRLHPVRGDLTQPGLGLNAATARYLAQAVTEVYHCGASVDMGAPYEELAPVNVTGTRTVLQFCRQGRPKRLHHVSSLGVFLEAGTAGYRVVDETAVPDRTTAGSIGYPRSKYDGEVAVADEAARGLDTVVYRPGLILADSRTGAGPVTDFVARILAAVVLTGCHPRSASRIPVSTVDHTAALIAALSLSDPPASKAYPVIAPEPLSLGILFDHLRRRGFDLREVSTAAWTAALRHHSPDRRALAMRRLTISQYLLGLSGEHMLSEFQCEQATKTAADLGVTPPRLDAAYFDRLLGHLAVHNVIPRPFPVPSAHEGEPRDTP